MKPTNTKRKLAKAKQEPMVRIVCTSLNKRLSENEKRGIAAAQVQMEMILESFQDEFPLVALSGLELFPCPTNCGHCRAASLM